MTAHTPPLQPNGISTPVIWLTPAERTELKKAWKERNDVSALIALQNDKWARRSLEEQSRLQDVSKVVRDIQSMQKKRHGFFIELWVWAKNVITNAAESAKKIRID
ncbi:MAG TPA: hypothetical protein VFM05_03525 [Candidatus Saccharimonadales bacterium]|nr:hypothetical protein [Candidatus Saccharimonadales bacterium]